jgi:ectoine hydroxylase-related dioxygenase (phytanoyl-CoA dioxygenase family)
MDALKGSLSAEQLAAFTPEPMILQAGECCFHHSHMVHGSAGNRSDHPRRAIVLNFMHPDTKSADGTTPLLAGVPLVAAGEVIEGDYFPLVLNG